VFQPTGRGLSNIDCFNEMTYAMAGLGPPAAGTAAAPAATGTAASERSFSTAEFTHALSFRRCLRHLTMRRYQGGERFRPKLGYTTQW
jgi:hypothetical protein